jgi:hypothetical protein
MLFFCAQRQVSSFSEVERVEDAVPSFFLVLFPFRFFFVFFINLG